MDPVNLLFYAVVCGTLGVASPWLGQPLRRIVIGAVVGVAAAILLPLIKAALGYRTVERGKEIQASCAWSHLAGGLIPEHQLGRQPPDPRRST